MKILIRMISSILLILAVAACLPACRSGDTDTSTQVPEGTSDDVTTALPDEIRATPLMENGKLKYNVIRYPADPDTVTFDAIKRLRDKIKEFSGTSPSLKPYYSSNGSAPSADSCEIFVGELDLEESKKALEGMNYGDYVITTVGNKIVVGAYSGEEIVRAVNYITVNMLKMKDEQGNYKLEITDYKYVAKRNINKVDINGIDLSEYSIAYGTEGMHDDHNLESARLLRSVFSEKAGYLLPLIKDTDECTTKRKIYVGIAFRGLPAGVTPPSVSRMSYAFKTVNEDFYVMGGGLLSNQLAAAEFVSMFFGARSADGKVSIKDVDGTFLRVSESPRAAGTEYRIMTYNITAQWEGWGGDYMPILKRYEGFRSVIDVYDPDVIGLQEVSSQWSEKILDEMSDEYAYVHRMTPDNKFVNLSTIIYKKAKFRVIDSGLQYFNPQGPNHIRLVTWAIFEDKQTGKQFAFFNTHWDPKYVDHHLDNIAVVNKVMADHPNVKYAFSTGDYNTKPGSDQYSAFISKTGLVNSMEVARAAGTLKNDLGGCAKIGVDKETVETTGPIDHIFVTKNISVLSYETVIWNQVHHVSDHSPKYADVVLGE